MSDLMKTLQFIEAHPTKWLFSGSELDTLATEILAVLRDARVCSVFIAGLGTDSQVFNNAAQRVLAATEEANGPTPRS